MKRIVTLVALVSLGLPVAVSAHEQHVYEINGAKYKLTVGSENEPIAVDDKTAVSLTVERVEGVHHAEAGHSHTPSQAALSGLEETLKVELQANGASKVLDLKPAYANAGVYYAPFYATAAVQLSYRFFGTIDGTPVDLTFTCSPAGHVMQSPSDDSRVEIAPGVARVSRSGQFGCPVERADMGFPHTLSSSHDSGRAARDAQMLSFAALGLSLAGVGAVLWRRRA